MPTPNEQLPQPIPNRFSTRRVLVALGIVLVAALAIAVPYFISRNDVDDGGTGSVNAGDGIGPDGAINAPSQNDQGTAEDRTTPTGRDWMRYSDVSAIRQALDRYFKDNKQYPDDLSPLAPAFMSVVPKDPLSPATEYVYAKGDLTYTIVFTLEDGVLTYSKGAHVVTPQGFDVVALPTPAPPDEVTTTVSVAPTGTQPVPSGEPAPDADGDKLSDADEAARGTNPASSDTDGDSLTDGYEVFVTLTNPVQADTDGDSFTDSSELQNGYEPAGPGALSDERKAQIQQAAARFATQ